MTRRRAPWIATLGLAGSAAILILAGAVPLIADVPVKPMASAAQAASIGDPLPLEADAPHVLRALPLGLTDEQRSDLISPDAPTDDSKVRDAIRAVAGRIGLENVIDEAIAAERISDPSLSYPYVIGGIDELVRPNLDLDAVRADPNAAVELSGLLIVLAGMQTGIGSTDGVSMPAGVAYSLLDAARAVSPTCDVQLNLTFLVTLGMSPEIENVDSEVVRATELCPDDPTPSWIKTKYLGDLLHDSGFEIPLPTKRSELRVEARKEYVKMRKDFPDSPLGWVGDADLLMQWATDSEIAGAEPFQVRSWRLEALDLYRIARTKSADPRLASDQARALSGLGEHDKALDLAREALKTEPQDLSNLIVMADVLSAAGHHSEAADAYVAELKASALWHYLVPTNQSSVAFTGAFGWLETPDLLVYDPTTGGYGGAGVKDTGFIPVTRYRPDEPFCPTTQQQAELVLADRIGDLNHEVSEAASWGARCTEDNSFYRSQAERYRGIAAVAGPRDARADALSNLPSAAYQQLDEVELDAWDTWQDLLRSGGELERAEDTAERWTKAQPDAGLAHQRLGEIRLLRKDPEKAIPPLKRAVSLLAEQADTGDAARDPESLTYPNMRDLAKLQLGYAQAESGNRSAGRKNYQSVVDAYTGSGTFWDDKLAMFAHSQLGELAFGQKQWKAAARSFNEAIELGRAHEDKILYGLDLDFEIGRAGMLRGAQENNLALAEAKQGHTKRAVAAARAALTRDARNPVYLDTLAFVHHLGGDDKAAAAAYEEAIGADTSSYVSSNNLAVVLAGAGKIEAARKLLKSSVAAKPDYATGWHNLGVLEARSWAPSALLSSQGALAKAARLDADQRGSGSSLQVDDEIYDSGLDVSRPLTAEWSYANSASSAARPITITMIILLLLRVLQIVGIDRVGSWIGERVLASNPANRMSVRWFWRRLRVRWGVAVSAVALVWGALFVRPDASTAVYVIAVAALVTLPLMARMALASRRHEQVQHFTWTPAVAVAALGTPFGLGFAPYPSIDDAGTAPSRAVRWISPCIVGFVAVAFITLTLATGSPLAREIGAGALLMGASVLTPVPPMDGASLNSRVTNIVITVLLAVATIAYAMHVI